jgi:hypothetical protein
MSIQQVGLMEWKQLLIKTYTQWERNPFTY